MQNKANLGQFIKKLREDRGVTLGEMEAVTGLSRSYINRLENSSRENPTLDSISRIVQYFGIPFSSIAEFCNCEDGNIGKVQNLDFILLNERYLFASIEANIDMKMLLRDLINELENYCTKVSITRHDEAKILDIAVEIRERLLSS